MNLRRLTTVLIVAAIAALALAGAASASGGDYVVSGGTTAERGEVVAALDASSFDWSLVPVRIHIHVAEEVDSCAVPGEIWLDARLLDSGPFGWGVVQHEYAHQVDFFLFDGATERTLNTLLHGVDWYGLGSPHRLRGVERFASTLAWSYWPSPLSAMRPDSSADESAAMPPARFRRLMARLLGAPQDPSSFAVRTTFGVRRPAALRFLPLGPDF